jgi:hypothetical protein
MTDKQAVSHIATQVARADETATSAAQQTLLGPAPHRAFSLSAAWRGALTGALAGPSCAPAPRGGQGSVGRTHECSARYAPAPCPQTFARLLSLPSLSSCTQSLPACPSMHVNLASAPACSLGRPARVRTCAELPKGTRASAVAGLAARLQLRPTEPRGPCAQARSCDALWCVVYAASHCVSQLGWRCRVRPRQLTPAMHVCSHACLSVQTCSAPGQCRALHSPAYEQVGNVRKLCIERG